MVRGRNDCLRNALSLIRFSIFCYRRWAFFLQIPILIISMVLVAFKVNIPLSQKPTTFREKLARIDYFGSITLVSFIGCLLIAITFLTTEEMPITTPIVFSLFIISGISLVAFILVEVYWSNEPILPMRLLKMRTPAAVAASNFFMLFVATSVLYHVPLYFSAVKLQTASQSGLHLLPNALANSVGSVFAGWFVLLSFLL